MPDTDKRSRREAAAEHFDTHGIDEGAEEGDEVEVEVSKPLSVILSIRMDDDGMKKLGRVARAQGVGITTMARVMRTPRAGR